jgi:hypothetical protein
LAFKESLVGGREEKAQILRNANFVMHSGPIVGSSAIRWPRKILLEDPNKHNDRPMQTVFHEKIIPAEQIQKPGQGKNSLKNLKNSLLIQRENFFGN